MTQWLVNKFTNNIEPNTIEYRERVGLLGGWGGLLSNLLLFIVKFLSGLFTGSISIMTDAVNNLSDSASSLITIVGFKASAMPADEEHPYGHARSESISGLVVAALILVIGIQFLVNSIKRIVTPQAIDFSWLIAGLLFLSIVAKILQSRFYKTLAQTIDSSVLLATSVDSRNDVVITVVVLGSSLLEYFTGWRLDGPIGLVASLFVIYSGIEILRDTLTELLGTAPDKELVSDITAKINSYPTVLGTHDLIVHNYGAGAVYATIHVEVPADQDIMVSHDILDNIERDFLLIHDIHLTVHMDPVITNDPVANNWEQRCREIVKAVDPVLSIHDFRMVKGPTHCNLIFDMTVPPRYKTSNKALREKIQRAVSQVDKRAYTVITIDRSYVSYID